MASIVRFHREIFEDEDGVQMSLFVQMPSFLGMQYTNYCIIPARDPKQRGAGAKGYETSGGDDGDDDDDDDDDDEVFLIHKQK